MTPDIILLIILYHRYCETILLIWQQKLIFKSIEFEIDFSFSVYSHSSHSSIQSNAMKCRIKYTFIETFIYYMNAKVI